MGAIRDGDHWVNMSKASLSSASVLWHAVPCRRCRCSEVICRGAHGSIGGSRGRFLHILSRHESTHSRTYRLDKALF